MTRAPFLLPALALALLAASGCGSRAARPAPPAAAAPAAGLDAAELRSALAATFDSPLVGALWAVKVQSLDSGAVLFERNPHLLVMPASNMKILTLAVTAERLGWDARFTTRIETDGTLNGGVLRGSLIVTGSGDPAIGELDGAPRVLDDWAARLRSLGLSRVEGRVIGDDDALGDHLWGRGWAWDDLAFGYAAPAGALQYNESSARLIVTPGSAAGAPAAVRLEPSSVDLELEATVSTAPAGTAADLTVRRLPFDRRLVVTGTVPQAGQDQIRTVSIDNPTRYLASAFRAALIARGIDVGGEAVDIDDLPAKPGPDRTLLFAHESPPLREIGVRFMKVSQNLIGETLLLRLGLAAADPADGDPVAAARRAYERTLNAWGVPSDAFIVSDGSGLSRYNYVTADALVTVLRRMALDPAHAAAFEATLPIMGRDGTLERRMRGTRAEGRVRAKTGTIANVRSLSGYVTTLAGERLVFSIVANNFKAPSAVVDRVTEQAVEWLVGYESGARRERGSRGGTR